MSGQVRFTVLGPFQAWRGTVPLDMGPLRQRAVLAMLLLHANRPVSPAKILDAVWDGRPPASGEAVVHSYVSRLRRVLEPEYLRGANTMLTTASEGFADRRRPGPRSAGAESRYRSA